MSIVHKNVIHKALTDPKFGKEVFTKLPLEPFDSGVTRELVQIIKRYYINHSQGLNQETLLTLAEEHINKRKLKDVEADEMFTKINQSYEVSEESNEDVLAESVQKFVRKSLSIQAIQETLSKSSFEEEGVIEDLSDTLREIAVIDAIGNDGTDVDFFGDYDKRVEMYNTMGVKTHPTGFDNVDALLKGGGMGVGQLGTVIAPTGSGKSTFLVQLVNNAVRNGLNAMYITLEEHADRMTSRLETNLIGRGTEYYTDDEGKIDEDKYSALDTYYKQKLESGEWGKLFIRTRQPYTSTIEDIEQMIIDVKVRSGTDLDVVVVDYPEIMKKKSSPHTSDEDIMGETFHRIAGLASKYEFVAWAVAQTNRTAGSADTITAHNIQGAYKVTNSTDFLMTLNRTPEEKQENCLRTYIDKIRYPEPSALRPDFLYFKTLVDKGFQVVPENDTEIARHQSLITGREHQNAGDQKVSANYGKVLDNVNDNLAFNG